ncbi:MAG: four helix bundle protein [Pedosphaera sp.]|nr:four helix bundle protein [Pedosphaera sp.]
MFNFEKLDVWQRANEFADLVYKVTKTFPKDKRFGLTDQMRRAAVSVSSNIAEGSARSSRNDNARFLEIATGSLFEVVAQSFISRRQGFLTEPDFKTLYATADELGRMLSGLRRSLRESARTE